jgi:hypothetical protein
VLGEETHPTACGETTHGVEELVTLRALFETPSKREAQPVLALPLE